ncbi:MAG TPA: hypothetical protein DCE42_05100 [Myxococcales bacterium]|nr:hypothetical protein [Myxococcales bacterium]
MRICVFVFWLCLVGLMPTKIWAQPASWHCETPNLLLGVDTSGSMGQGNYLDALKKAVDQVVQNFKHKLRFGLVHFANDKVTLDVPIGPADPKDIDTHIQKLQRALAAFRARGNTPMNAAMKFVRQQYQTQTIPTDEFHKYTDPNAKRVHYVLLFTDGQPTDGDPTPSINSLRTLKVDSKQYDIKTYVVGLAGGIEKFQLNTFAQTGGTSRFYHAQTTQDLGPVFQRISQDAANHKEVCNNIDDNCDGSVDEYIQRECQSSCGPGLQVCVNGVWNECIPPGSHLEACDGHDNDCDGQIDEDADLINAPLCLKQRGDCKGATTPTRLCQNGRWLPCDDNTYKAHFSAYNRTESCDKKDNDCNGQIDEHIKGCLSIIAGGGPKGASDGFGTEAEFNIPQGLLLKDGNIYVSDTNNHQIRKIDPCGNVTTIAGSGVRGFKDGPPLQAELHSPRELLAYKGDILIADAYNHRIRRLSGNTLTTFLGGPQQGLKDGPIGQATTQDPRTLYLASSQHIYFVDSKRNTIRFVHNETTVGSTLINSLPSLFRPVDFFETSSGELYVINDDYAVYKLLPGGTLQQPEKTVVHVAGVVKDKQVGTAQDGNVASVEFRYPEGITIDNNGVLYIADTGRNRIRTIENGQVKTILTSANGPINEPVKLDFDGDGNLFILVKSSNRVLKWNINNTSQRTTTCIDVWAGLPNKESTPPKGLRNGYRLQALFNNPYMMLFAKSGEAFISDTSNYRIRKIDITGKLSDLAGGVYGFKDDFQSQASFKHPAGIALDKQGNLYVADSENHRIRKIDASGNVTTFAGTGLAGYKDGTGNVAQFDTPVGLAFDDVGDLYVIGNNKRIRTIDPSGNVSTFAGGGRSLEGARQNISITAPKHLLFGPDRALYFSDGHRIRKIDTSGNVTTFAGTGTAGYKDGSGKTAQLNEPFGMAFGPFGSLFVADRGNRRIRKISPTGVVTTIAGGTKGFGVGGVASPSGANIPFYTPTHLTFDPRGNLYITDTESQRVFKMTFEW